MIHVEKQFGKFLLRTCHAVEDMRTVLSLQRTVWNFSDEELVPVRLFVVGEKIGGHVLGAFDGEDLIGTVTLVLNLAQNQPHRAEIVKMMTRVSHRHRGIATLLLREAERIAIERGRWLLVLDTAEDEGAAGLYERMGFKLTGLIPDYALKPHGGLTGTLIYWKRLQDAVPA